MSRRDEAKARIQRIIDTDGEAVLREKHARGDFIGPAEKEARFRIRQFDKASDDGRHKETRKLSRIAIWLSSGTLVVAVLALLWTVFG